MKLLFLSLVFLSSTALAYHEVDADNHVIVKKDMIKWLATSALPKGAEVAVLHGDPMKAGEFTMRIRLPANYSVPPHFHAAEEHVTILEGTVHFGMGEKFDQKLFQTVSAGDFLVMVPGTKHFVHTATPTIIQVHAVGPWSITYVNPADDPRR